MLANAAFTSLDGETLIVPQKGALDITTEMGRIMVRPKEIAVIPRGVVYRVTLPPSVSACRGYIFELFEGHSRLPELGVVGTTGLANPRDLQIPVAYFPGTVDSSTNMATVSQDDSGDGWEVTSRLGGTLWARRQDHTPFDVAAWHGNNYPYKYDLSRFCPLGNTLFDHHDPSLYTVLTAPSFARQPGTAVVDFCVVPTEWAVAEDTFRLPYWHRNTMREFMGAIVSPQGGGGGGDTDDSSKSGDRPEPRFHPFAAALNGAMVGNGQTEDDYEAARASDTRKAVRGGGSGGDGVVLFLLETDCPLMVSDWAWECSVSNFGAQ